MILRYRIACGTWVLLLPFTATAVKTPDQFLVQERAHVVSVEMMDAHGKLVAQGSGIALGEDQVITTCDVAGKGKDARVRWSGRSFKAKLRDAQADRNLCRMIATGMRAPPLELGTAQKLRTRQVVYAFGLPHEKTGGMLMGNGPHETKNRRGGMCPMCDGNDGRKMQEGRGRTPVLSEGTVSALRPYEGSRYALISVSLLPGFSGGGLFDDGGRLIGVLSPRQVEGEMLAFSLPVDWIIKPSAGAEDSPEPPATAAEESGLHYLNRALALENQAHWTELLNISQEAIKRDSSNAAAWFSAGIASANLNQHDRAVKAYREAIRHQLEYDEAWHRLGLAYSRLGEHENAIQAYADALRMQPGNAAAWYDLGNAYRELKRYAHAIHAYREALDINPLDADAWYNLGLTYDDLKLHDEAAAAYGETVRIQAGNASAWYNLGVDYAILGERNRMKSIYNQLLKLDPPRAEQYFNTYVLP